MDDGGADGGPPLVVIPESCGLGLHVIENVNPHVIRDLGRNGSIGLRATDYGEEFDLPTE